jgi:hypothetical protein
MSYAPLIRHLRRSKGRECPERMARVAQARRESMRKVLTWLTCAVLVVAYGLIAQHCVLQRAEPDAPINGGARGSDG